MKTLIVIFLIVLAASRTTVPAQTTFTKIILDDLGATGCAWGDVNNDGFLDLFLTEYAGTNVFYLNNTNGTFTKITQGEPVAAADYHVECAWGDYDNDGHLDLLVAAGVFASTARNNLLYHNNGDATLSLVSGGSVTNQLGFFGVCAWADYDNDGFLDFFVGNQGDSNGSQGKAMLFHNNGDGTFTRITEGAVVNDLSRAFGVQWADYDNDGFMDLLVINNFMNFTNFEGGLNFLYRNNRDGTFTRVLTNDVATDRENAVALCGAWGDYDNDGFQDLFLTGGDGEGENLFYHNDVGGSFTKITSGPMLSIPLGVSARGCAWGDFDNDGYLDLFVTYVGQNNALFHNNQDGTFSEVLSGDPVNDGNANIASWVDYDNDGFLDLFTSISPDPDSPSQQSVLYHNGGNSNGWLEVKCVGTVANRSAIGTKVRVKATIGGKTLWQLREINHGGGNNTVPLVTHFGLGDATVVDTVRIEWPSGTVQEFHNVAPKQIWTITEPPRLSATVMKSVPQFTLKGGRGFQYQIDASTNLTAWSSIGTLTITNLNGTAAIIDTNAPASDLKFYRAVSR
jgi:hypothetical protein